MTGWLRRGFGGRRWIAWAATAAVVAGVGSWWFGIRPNSATAADAPTTTTTTVTASLQTMEKTVSASGTLTPAVQQEVNFAASGRVLSVDVAAGQTVKKGQRLATIDTTQLTVNQAQAKLTLAQAEERLTSAKSAYTGSATTAAALELAKAQLASAEQSKTAADAAMSGATLTAPVAGLLTAVTIAVGDSVTAGTSQNVAGDNAGSGGGLGGNGGGAGGTGATGSTAQFTIIGTESWIVTTTVSESDVGHVAPGEQVTMTTDSSSEPIFGTVETVSTVASSSSGSAEFPVTIAVTGTPAGLHDGVSVTASIVYERRTDVLTVPSAAVTSVDGAATVTKVDAEGKQTKQTVTVGETSGTLTEITAGLAEGDSVLVTVVTGGRDRTGTGTGNQQRGGQFPGGTFEMPGGNQRFGGGQGGPGGPGGPVIIQGGPNG